MSVTDLRQTKLKAISKVRYLLIMACLLSGWMAGNSIEKTFIRVNAWRKMDPLQWAEFSRHEYLGFGFYFHVAEAVGCLLLLLTALIIVNNQKLKFIKWHLIFALIFSVLFTVLTFLIAPIMFQLKGGDNDADMVKLVFEKVNRLSFYRSILHLACFVLCLFAVGRSFVLRYVNNY
jgi:hypothetical protein